MDKENDIYLQYLDNLRESGETNMFGAVPFLMIAFPELDKSQAKTILMFWMTNFDEGPWRERN